MWLLHTCQCCQMWGWGGGIRRDRLQKNFVQEKLVFKAEMFITLGFVGQDDK